MYVCLSVLCWAGLCWMGKTHISDGLHLARVAEQCELQLKIYQDISHPDNPNNPNNPNFPENINNLVNVVDMHHGTNTPNNPDNPDNLDEAQTKDSEITQRIQHILPAKKLAKTPIKNVKILGGKSQTQNQQHKNVSISTAGEGSEKIKVNPSLSTAGVGSGKSGLTGYR